MSQLETSTQQNLNRNFAIIFQTLNTITAASALHCHSVLAGCRVDQDDVAVMLMGVATLVHKVVLKKKYQFSSSLCDE